MKKITEPLAARVKRLRAAAGLSQAQLAAKSGVSVDTLQNAEQGRVKALTVVNTIALADALGVGVRELVEGAP